MDFTNTFCIMDIFSVPGSFQQYVVHMEHSGQCGAEFINMVVQDLPLPPHNATSCQYNMWYLIQLLMTLYVVSSP
ncbi:hypothetical protein JTY30_005006 [Escherichia coli]|nr:hypothetical protein [Escherichia coli]